MTRGRSLYALAVALVVVAGAAHPSLGEASPDGLEVAQRNNARDDGALVTRTIRMELINKRGKVRERVTRSFRRDFQDSRRSVLFFEEPPGLEGTAFLTYDYPDVQVDDDQWIYLPALRKSRRIATADRGRSFLGTDFSFEDIKNDTRLSVDDYRWSVVGEERVRDHPCWLLEAVPVDEETERELGYSRVLYRIDREIWMPRRAEFWGVNGAPLKTVDLYDVREVDGVWTAFRVEVANHRSGHRTRFLLEDVAYGTDLDEDLFTEAALRRGSP